MLSLLPRVSASVTSLQVSRLALHSSNVVQRMQGSQRKGQTLKCSYQQQSRLSGRIPAHNVPHR